MATQHHVLKRVALLVAALLCLGVAPAMAVPDGGAGPNTPGTSGSVSPRQLAAGDTLRFTVSGFPAGEVVYVKIDDGNFCSDKGVHGACVVHQQRLGSNGSASGSFVVPGDLPPGKHWLRFLASEEIVDDQGRYLGTKGYTTRAGTDFTVVAGGGGTTQTDPSTPSDTTSSSPGSTTAGTSGDDVEVLAAGEVLTVSAGEKKAGAKKGRTDTQSDAADLNAETDVEVADDDVATATVDDASLTSSAPAVTEERFPWVGAAGLAVFLVLGAGLLVRRRRA